MFGNQGDQTGTVGGNDFTISVDAGGHFRATYRIPRMINGYQGNAGGAVIPGRYGFYSLPPYCFATFTVTPGSLALGGIGPAPIIGLILLAIGLLLLMARRTPRRLGSGTGE